jgi:hypothetical protein
MTRNSKQRYEAPLTRAFEVEQKCVICASPYGDTESFGNRGIVYGNGDFD